MAIHPVLVETDWQALEDVPKNTIPGRNLLFSRGILNMFTCCIAHRRHFQDRTMRRQPQYSAFSAVVFLTLVVLPAIAPAQPAPEAALENKTLRMVGTPGQPGVAVFIKSDQIVKRMELAIMAGGATQCQPISDAQVIKNDAGHKVLHITAGTAEADLSLGSEGYVKITPGKNAASVEVRTGARYAVLPDFFADDVVFDPEHFSVPSLTVPAENFLLQFIEGGNTIVMCDWAGTLQESQFAGWFRITSARAAGRSGFCRRGKCPADRRVAD